MILTFQSFILDLLNKMQKNKVVIDKEIQEIIISISNENREKKHKQVWY